MWQKYKGGQKGTGSILLVFTLYMKQLTVFEGDCD